MMPNRIKDIEPQGGITSTRFDLIIPVVSDNSLSHRDFHIDRENIVIPVEYTPSPETNRPWITTLIPGLGASYDHELSQSIKKSLLPLSDVVCLGNITEQVSRTDWGFLLYVVYAGINNKLPIFSQLKHQIIGLSLGGTALLDSHLQASQIILVGTPPTAWKFMADNQHRIMSQRRNLIQFGQRGTSIFLSRLERVPQIIRSQVPDNLASMPETELVFTAFGINAPIVLITAQGDRIVPNSDSDWLAQKLKEHDQLSSHLVIPSDQLLSDSEIHNFTGTARQPLLSAINKAYLT